MRAVTESLQTLLRRYATPLVGARSDFDPILAIIGEATIVLIGEASHGTHEFYRARAEITKRLIVERGFSVVAVEADWPDAYRVNCFVRGTGRDPDAAEALSGFRRFPQWMWRNADVVDFIEWLRAHNEATGHRGGEVGFYGLDLYSLRASIAAVLRYLRTVDPDASRRAAQRYACFDHFGDDPQAYGYAAELRLSPSCERDVVAQLVELHAKSADYSKQDGRPAADALFYATQNAQVVRNAERYYRAMFAGRGQSWNLRDTHMADTLDALMSHLGAAGRHPKVVVWAHNSHLGDARATELGSDGELNVGQLVRERRGADSVLIGLTTYTGSVTAASDWDAPAERMGVRPALTDSYEAAFHEADIGSFVVGTRSLADVRRELSRQRLERAIGVIYRPATERASHYFRANMAEQFDAILHYDVTGAVEPLERTAEWHRGQLDETYPSAL